MKNRMRTKWLVWGSLFAVLALWVISAAARPAGPGGNSVNVKATFESIYDGKAAKIVGGPFTGKSTGGILDIGRKFGMLDLRFYPGKNPLTMWLDQMISPGNCQQQVPMPGSPFSIYNLSVFTYREALLDSPCSGGNPIPGYSTTEEYLNLLGMAAEETLYVQIHIRFEVTGFPHYFVMRPNKTDAIESQFVGIVSVTARDLNVNFPGVDHWEFKPMACPISPVELVDEANINHTYPVGRNNGSCSHGNYVVPFLLVIDRI